MENRIFLNFTGFFCCFRSCYENMNTFEFDIFFFTETMYLNHSTWKARTSDWLAAVLAANQKLHLKIVVSYPCFYPRIALVALTPERITIRTAMAHISVHYEVIYGFLTSLPLWTKVCYCINFYVIYAYITELDNQQAQCRPQLHNSSLNKRGFAGIGIPIIITMTS